MNIPSWIAPADFSAALSQFATAIGAEWVFSEKEDVDLYRDAYSPYWNEEKELRASAAVAPATVEEVQQVVRIANQYKIPLFPISTGKNLGYGGSAPSYNGSVVVDLKRMNRIIEVDDKRHFAIVEPGVSYFDLYNYIRRNKLRVWIDTPEPGWGSVVGNSLDRGIGWSLAHYRDHFESHCGMEVVLANGEVIRTGMGALPGADTWAQYPHGFGPSVDGLFAQGNFGIVTKMGFWLMPEPEAYMTAKVMVPKRRDLIPLVDVITQIEHAELIGLPHYDSQLAYMNDPELLALTSQPGGPTDEDLDRYAQSRGIPAWECTLSFYGPDETVDANWRYTQRKLKERIPSIAFEQGRKFSFPMSDEEMEQVPFGVSIGVPSLEAFSRSGARSRRNPTAADGHLLLSPVFPKTGEAALEVIRTFAPILQAAGGSAGSLSNPWFSAPQAWIHRSFNYIIGFPIMRSDPELNKRSRDGWLEALRIGAERGWGEYRTSPVFSEAVANIYSYNDYALRRFNERLKDAADPNGILAPGRSGIWPKHLRESKA